MNRKLPTLAGSTVLVAAALILAACGTNTPDGALGGASTADGEVSADSMSDSSSVAADAGGEVRAVSDVDSVSGSDSASRSGPANGSGANADAMTGSSQSKAYNQLTADEAKVILNKGTEWRGTGEYTDLDDKGTYICRQCNIPLYRSDQKFHSGCGWPAFDDEIDGRVDRVPDADGLRTEIVCNNCKGHLGHVFLGEGFTPKNARHCVNSISMRFIADGSELPAPIVLGEKE